MPAMNEQQIRRFKRENNWLAKNGLKRCGDLVLFSYNIKPAILIGSEAKDLLIKLHKENKSLFEKKVIMRGIEKILLSRTAIPEKDLSDEDLGVILGYYPPVYKMFGEWSKCRKDSIFF